MRSGWGGDAGVQSVFCEEEAEEEDVNADASGEQGEGEQVPPHCDVVGGMRRGVL